MSTTVRLAVAVAVAVALVVGGALVPRRDEPALERLRAFLWLGATVAGAVAGGLFVHDVAPGTDAASAVVLGGAAVVTVSSLLLWRQRERPVQQATFIVGALVTAGTLAAQWFGTGTVGLVVWAVAVVFLASGIAHLTPTAWITVGLGAAGAMVGAALFTANTFDSALALVTFTAGALLALAMLERPVRAVADRVVLYVVGGFGMLQAAAPTLVHFGHRAGILTGTVTMIVGASLLYASRRPFMRAQLPAQLFGGALMVGGAAIMGMQSPAVAIGVGLITAAELIALGTVPGYVLMSIFGCLGLLINVPWAIGHFFPGQGRAPLLITVSGLLIVLVAVWLSHQGGELRHTFRRRHT